MPCSLYSLLDALTSPAAVGLAMFAYDYLLTLGDEIKYIWRRPVTGIKILYLILRYGVAFAELVYFQDIMLIRVYTLWDHRRWTLKILHIGYFMSALFDVFLFILTLFNAASRPRRANVKIITDLRRDGCLFYLVCIYYYVCRAVQWA
ncbi:hypothetical protein BJV77DRAFT_944580 [Russula vinacea]|nr:hypothetical protein BJV77DRAFT_944580 [Russula vinacea]